MSSQGYWDKIATSYDRLFADPYSSFEDEFVFSHLKKLGISRFARVLELGCGTGLGHEMVSRLGCDQYVGIDASEAMIAVAKGRYPKATFIHGDMLSLDDGLGDFDVVFCINGVGSYAPGLEGLINSASMRTRGGGVIFLSFLNRWSLRRLLRFRLSDSEPLHCRGGVQSDTQELQRVYGSAQLKKSFQKAGFRNVETTPYGCFGGVLQTTLTSKAESLMPVLGRYFGHTIHVVGEKND
ncbi:MAG: class I SAM-dependent methyltransferase [Roseobacter sp.]